jgi:hypothetical protein
MARPTSFLTLIQNLVREQVEDAIHALLGTAGSKKKAKNGRRRRRKARGKWRPGGPGRPPGSASKAK